eukprot:SAG31_NODE_110_length_24476_cov_9.909654_2_plen_342_part_00
MKLSSSRRRCGTLGAAAVVAVVHLCAATASWVEVYSVVDNKAVVDLAPARTNQLFRAGGGVLRYDIKGVTFAVYQRLTDVDSFDAHAMLTSCWTSARNGRLNLDFTMFGSVADWEAGSSRWEFCNYDDSCAAGLEVGAFRDCAASGPPGNFHKFHNLLAGSHQGESDTAFYVFVPSAWGSAFTLAVLAAGAGYVSGGVLLGRRQGRGQGLSAHPHVGRWRWLAALVADGIAWSKRRAGGGTPRRSRINSPSDQKAAANNRPAARRTGKKKEKQHRGNEDSGGKKAKASNTQQLLGNREGGDSSNIRKSGTAVETTESGGGPSSEAKVTASAGGGKWVHVPD